jgi:glycosyltransferase involved in cell wall biosynthesis
MTLGAVSWSPNPKKGHETIAQFSKLPGVRVRFIGNWPSSVDPGRVERLPAVPYRELGDFYRSCDAFLFPAEGESCPNVVLEAMACGLPVLYHASGGTPEIAEPYGVPLDKTQPYLSLARLRESYSDLWKRLHDDADQFSVQRAGQEYLRLFESLL